MKRLIYFFKRIDNKKALVLTVLFLFAIVFSIVHLSYALFSVRTEKGGAFTFTVGELPYQLESLSLDESKSLMIGAGEKKTIELTVTNPNDIASHFKLYYLGGSDEITVFYVPNATDTNGVGTLLAGNSLTYTVFIENKSLQDATITLGVQGGLLHQELSLNQGRELEAVYIDQSGANRPLLVQGQIPVVYDQNRSSWVKADTSKKWYDYNNQEWANVVTVKETGTKTRGEYMSATPGTVISMDDINTMWVWIPRYEYMYTNLGTNYAGGTQDLPGEIGIHFLSGITTSPSDATSYKVHPAFTFGSDELEGIWFSKFELATTNSTCNTNSSVANCDIEMSSLQVVPNVVSWENASVSTFFSSIRNMQLKYASTYGVSQTDSDIHMIKNSEWGAVAYLSQSKYGKFGNPDYAATEKEIRKNNCSRGITGIGTNNQADDITDVTCTTNTYETAKGMASSTTGNITGIYDMNGGRQDLVMGVLLDSSGNPISGQPGGNSGFNGVLTDGSIYSSGLAFPDPKYFQSYVNTNLSIIDGNLTKTACNGGVCYGDALSETLGYYQDDAHMILPGWPWFVRGGQNDNVFPSGIFSFRNFYGGAYPQIGTRSVWVPL